MTRTEHETKRKILAKIEREKLFDAAYADACHAADKLDRLEVEVAAKLKPPPKKEWRDITRLLERATKKRQKTPATIMKTKALTAVLVLGLATINPRAQTRPQPQCFTCIMTWLSLGLFAACAVVCYWHAWHLDNYSGPTNAPPIVPIPPMPTNNIDTNKPPMLTNASPGIVMNAYEGTEHLDVTASNWLDSAGGQVTDLYRTKIEEADSLGGPWSNRYVVTHWASAYGSTAVLEVDGKAILTNYALRDGASGGVTNSVPLPINRTAPQKFWRGKP